MAKTADDLYVGGNRTEGLYHNWSRVLDALHQNSLKLKASKTFIAPTHAQILGWDWIIAPFPQVLASFFLWLPVAHLQL